MRELNRVMVKVSDRTARVFQLELKARELFSEVYNWVEQEYGESNVDRIMEEDFACLLSAIALIEDHRNEVISWAICDIQKNSGPELII